MSEPGPFSRRFGLKSKREKGTELCTRGRVSGSKPSFSAEAPAYIDGEEYPQKESPFAPHPFVVAIHLEGSPSGGRSKDGSEPPAPPAVNARLFGVNTLFAIPSASGAIQLP